MATSCQGPEKAGLPSEKASTPYANDISRRVFWTAAAKRRFDASVFSSLGLQGDVCPASFLNGFSTAENDGSSST